MKRCIVTNSTFSHAHWAPAWAESIAAHNPGIDCLVFVLDVTQQQVDSHTWPFRVPVKLFGGDCITNPAFLKLRLYYMGLEYAAAAKAFVLDYVVHTLGYEEVIFLDADTQCYASLASVWDALATTSVVLTPHIMSPCPDDAESPNDKEIEMFGFINAGFWGVRNTPQLPAILQWMQHKVTHYGFMVPEEIGICAEQTWLSSLPWLFHKDVRVLFDAGLNVAYWNLYERPLRLEGASIFAKDAPLVFFHYSGFNYQHPDALTGYTTRSQLPATLAVLAPELRTYAEKLRRANQAMPALTPALPCCRRPLRVRLGNYRRVYGIRQAYAERALLGALAMRFAVVWARWNKRMARGNSHD